MQRKRLLSSIKHIATIKEFRRSRLEPLVILGIFAHPDDETLLAGGLFAAAYTQHTKTIVVTVTRGELGGRYSGVYGRKLALMRSRELNEAAKVLRVGRLIHLSYPDKGVDEKLEQLTSSLAAIIRKQSPHIIFTHDVTDPSQHVDHIALARAVIRAWENVSSSNQRLYLATTRPSLHKECFAFDIEPFLEVKKEALKTHVSQGLLRAGRSAVPLGILWQLRHFEYFAPYEERKTSDHKRRNSNKG